MEFEKSRIERLKRDLYSRDENRLPKETRGEVHSKESDVPRSWGDSETFELSHDMSQQKSKKSFFSSFLGISLIFFCISLGVSASIFYGGFNMISSNNVDIQIVGSSSVSSGEELSADLTIVNNNRTDLENAVLYVEYPEGTLSPGTDSKPILRDKIILDTVSTGKSVDQSIRALLFGETGSIKTITFRIEYTVKGSVAVFSKEKTYDISMGSSPIIMNVTYPSEVNSGQTVTLTIDLTSNSSVVLPHTMVKVDYPYGFTYKTSNIKPVGDRLWDVGGLKDGDKKTLTISGTLVGQDLEERTFKISAGTKSKDSSKDLSTTLAVSSATVAIHKSFFDLTMRSSSGNLISQTGNSQVNIRWQNTLSDKLVNNTIEAVISGNAFNRASVTGSNGGFYRSVDNTIIWNKNSVGVLSDISPGDSGDVGFSVGVITDPFVLRSIKNPHIDITTTMTGNKLSSGDSAPIKSTSNITLKMRSTLGLSTKSFRNSGPFTNTGPIPPRSEKLTTYTVTWTLTNTNNDLSGVSVSGSLPQNVTWKNQTSPTSERVSYNPDTRMVVWNVGNIGYGTGYSNAPKTVSFLVELAPSITDIGSTLPLLLDPRAGGMDTYTESALSAVSQTVTTLYSDPNFVNGDDLVKP